MASKRRSRTVEILPLRTTTRRAAATKTSRQVVKKPEQTKLISELTKSKNVIREIEKVKPGTRQETCLVTEKKPQVFGKQLKQKKVHKCGICLKVFKGKIFKTYFESFFQSNNNSRPK